MPASRASATHSTSSQAGRERSRRTPRASRGTASTSSRRVTWSRTSPTTSSSRPVRGTTSSRSMRWSSTPSHVHSRGIARSRRSPPSRVRPSTREPHRRRPHEAVSLSADPNREDPRMQAAHQARRSPAPLPILPAGLSRARGSLQRPTSGNGRGTRRCRRGPRRLPATRLPPQPRSSHPTTRPRNSPRSQKKLRQRAGLPKDATGVVAESNGTQKNGAQKTRAKASPRPR